MWTTYWYGRELDPRQKRVFESIIKLLLSFHDFKQDDYNDSTLTPESCDHARRIKQQLLFLKGGGDATDNDVAWHGTQWQRHCHCLSWWLMLQSTAKISDTFTNGGASIERNKSAWLFFASQILSLTWMYDTKSVTSFHKTSKLFSSHFLFKPSTTKCELSSWKVHNFQP